MGKTTTALVDELEKLAKLHQDGLLTEAEFSKAKDKLLSGDENGSDQKPTLNTSIPSKTRSVDRSSFPSQLNQWQGNDDLGRAANRWVSMQTVMGIITIIIFCIFALFTCSRMNNHTKRMAPHRQYFPSHNR